MRRRTFLASTAAAAVCAAAPRALRAKGHEFAAGEDGFRLDGRPLVIRSGSMHYPRVPRPYWRDRMRKLRALGLNTVCSYVFWNLHEPRPGAFDFTGQNDLAAYVKTAQEEGLYVILRPGPYVCTEWDFGGFPAWLLRPPGVRVRSRDPRFLEASARYLKRVGAEVAHLQVERGGPILMVQVENEYGSYGDDLVYLGAIRDQIRAAGFRGVLYTSNGPGAKMLRGGSLPGLTSVINFGDDDNPEPAFAELKKFRATGPRMCGEYWCGWFDHWGERHHTTPPEHAARGLDWMLSRGISCNLYMAHGGTSFGFMAGANYGRNYEPDTSSYDYDAPIDEAGRPTAKFTAIRAVMEQHLPAGERLPELPAALPMISIPEFELAEFAPLRAALGVPQSAPAPLPMEALGQNYGLVLYRTQLPAAGQGTLQPLELRDYARVYVNGREMAELDRSRGRVTAEITAAAGDRLELLAENMGRINFGSKLADNQQGITASVRWNGTRLSGWEMYPLPLADVSRLPFTAGAAAGPGLYRGSLVLQAVGDTFLDMSGWDKGYVWVNGHNLGRFWRRGPQQSLFLPGCWLRRGRNEVIVFDYTPQAAPRLSASPEQRFGSGQL
jgi:beta-galactosidase